MFLIFYLKNMLKKSEELNNNLTKFSCKIKIKL